MTTQDYQAELEAERRYVAALYDRLDAERARAKDRYSAALKGDIDKQDGSTLVNRDADVRALGKEVSRLDVADSGLCFGQLESIEGERSYIGRLGLFDNENDYEPLLLDWRAPAARAFYVAVFDFSLDANPDLPGLDFTFLRRPDGHEIGGILGDPAAVTASWGTLFEVEDTDATVARVIAAGGTSTTPSDFVYGRIAEVSDPFGARFSVGSRPSHSQG